MIATRFNHHELMHGRDYAGGDCTGHIAQRKWNGNFAGWDGVSLFTKSGNPILAPDWFTEGLPDLPLCCELVARIEGAREATNLLQRKGNAGEWRTATLRVFDAPECRGGLRERLALAGDVMRKSSFAIPVETFDIRERNDLRSELQAALSLGWEGLMIQPADHG